MTRRPIGLALGITLILGACAAPSASPSAEVSGEPSLSAEPSASTSVPTTSQAASQAPDALAWRQLSTEGEQPNAREDHTWTLTPDGSTAYLFGGRDGATVYDDLWAYDLATNTWIRTTPGQTRPPGRFGHNAVWADGIGLVVFAGQAGATFFNDLWALDPASLTWRQLPAGGAVPVPRYGSCAAIGPDGRLWISHGFTSEGQRFADTRAYDFVVGEWTDETPAAEAPIPRCLHACWWTDTNQLVLYAGQTSGVTALDDLWTLTPGPRPGTNAWSQAAALSPARNLYAATRTGDGTLVFGGQALDASFLADTWLIGDAGEPRFVVVEAAPPARAGGEMVAADGRVLLFGGRGDAGALDDVWELTLP